MGILLAVFAIVNIGGKSLAEIIDLSGIIQTGNIGALIAFGILILTLFKFSLWHKDKKA